ncbi:MAG: hypothetical protein QXM75_00910, partial [Candidatus Diapherotrites archaeon]
NVCNCNEYCLVGPMQEAGVYTITANIPQCTEIECTKSTSFNVFEKTGEEAAASETSIFVVIIVALTVLLIVKKDHGEKVV